MNRPQDDRPVLTLRVAPALKARLLAYAGPRCLTLNAAAIVLLDQALSSQEPPVIGQAAEVKLS